MPFDKINAIGQGCHLVQTSDKRVLVQSRNQGPMMMKGRFTGRGPFDVIDGHGLPDRVICGAGVSEEEAALDAELPIWIPTLQLGVSFSFGGTPNTLTLTPSFNLLDVGVAPHSPNLQYPWDETTTFTVTSLIITPSASDSWTDTGQADNGFHEDTTPYDIVWTDDNEVTEIRVSVYAPAGAGNVLIYQILLSYQFALSGSSPTVSTVEFVLENSAFA